MNIKTRTALPFGFAFCEFGNNKHACMHHIDSVQLCTIYACMHSHMCVHTHTRMLGYSCSLGVWTGEFQKGRHGSLAVGDEAKGSSTGSNCHCPLGWFLIFFQKKVV